MKRDIALQFILILAFQIRQNVLLHRSSFDMNDPLLVEGPAKGAHGEYIFRVWQGFSVLNMQSW